MVWRVSRRAGRRARVLAIAALLRLFGFPLGNSESTEREEWYGTVDCPETLSVELNDFLSRLPYVEKKGNSTRVPGGLFRGMVLFTWLLDLTLFCHQNAPGSRNEKFYFMR